MTERLIAENAALKRRVAELEAERDGLLAEVRHLRALDVASGKEIDRLRAALAAGSSGHLGPIIPEGCRGK